MCGKDSLLMPTVLFSFGGLCFGHVSWYGNYLISFIQGFVNRDFWEEIMSNSEQFQILNGPESEGLFKAMRLRHEGKAVYFELRPLIDDEKPNPEVICRFLVDGISVYEQDGKKWLLKLRDEKLSLGAKYFCGYYNSADCTGWLRIDN